MHHHICNKPFDAENVKKVLKSYQSFAFKKNMLEIGIAFIMANAFNKIITALSEDIFMPIINLLTNSELEKNWRNFEFKMCDGLVFEIGKFIGSIIDFLIITILFYIIIKFISPITDKIYPSNDTICDTCQMTINKNAKKCPYCLTEINH